MPPKVKITKKEIIDTALQMCRESGVECVNARSVASAIGCSTQPIFSNFASMEDLQNAVIIKAYELYTEFLQREAESGKYPVYKSYGMAYIRFASEEKELFKLLFMCDRTGKSFIPTTDFDASVEMIMNANKITKEKAELMHLEMWVSVHGIATILATSFLSLEWELISNILTDIYQGIRAKHVLEDK